MQLTLSLFLSHLRGNTTYLPKKPGRNKEKGLLSATSPTDVVVGSDRLTPSHCCVGCNAKHRIIVNNIGIKLIETRKQLKILANQRENITLDAVN